MDDASALFSEHYQALFRYLVRFTGDADLAADAAQEAFVRLLKRPPPEGATRAWLFTVGINAAREVGRTRSRRRGILERAPERAPIADPLPTPAAELEQRQRRELVQRALATLPERERIMLLMREEGFSHREIAEAAGVAPGSVGTLVARALDRLAKQLPLDRESAE